MKKILIPFVIIATLFSCNKKTEQNILKQDSTGVFSDEETSADSALATTTACYMEATGKDTLFAQIDDNLGTISGVLHYKNFQKDSSSGDIIGFSSGDTIKVDYTFQSEGITSIREIWFLKKDGKLWEGIGAYDATGERYADAKKIKFEEGHVLSTANCKDIHKNLVISTPPANKPPKPIAETAKPVENQKADIKQDEVKKEDVKKVETKNPESQKETKTTAKDTNKTTKIVKK